jgi:uncharacterized protein with GYD domain
VRRINGEARKNDERRSIMAKYVMLGRYSVSAIQEASVQRTEKAVTLIKKLGGKLVEIYALLGAYDLILVVEFPEIKDVMKASMALTKLTDIAFTTSPAIQVEEFDKLLTER